MAASRGDALAVTRVDDYAGFLSLRAEWNVLAAERSVFLRHEWFDAAWQWRQSENGTRLAILCVRDNASLVGIFPLLSRTERSYGLTTRVLEFISVPDSQCCDLLIAKDQRATVAQALVSELSARRRDWDTLRLGYLPESSIAERHFLPTLAPFGIRNSIAESSGNPYVALGETWPSYYSERSRSLKKTCNLAANRLAKAGSLRIEWLAPGTADTTTSQSFFDAAVAVSAASWKNDTGNSLNFPGPQAFFRKLFQLALAEGWLSMWLLLLNDKPLATEIQLIFAGRVHALRSDFDQAQDELSPGTHLNRHLLEKLFEQGLDRYLMGPGDNPYKKRWTDQAEKQFRIDAYSPSARGRVGGFWNMQLKPGLRRLRARINKTQES